MLQFLGRFEILAGLGLTLVCAAIILSIRRRLRGSVPSVGSEPKRLRDMIQFFPALSQRQMDLDEAADEKQDGEEEEPEDSSTPKPRNIIGSTHGWHTVEPSFKTTPRIPEKIHVASKSKKKSWKYRSVFIVWLDSSTLESWMHVEEAEKLAPSKVASVGWIIHEADKYLVLASSIGEDDVCLIPTIILKAAILHMEEIPFGYSPASS